MRALVELTPAERKMMQTLTTEEREAVIEQMLEKVREELEWVVVVDRAHVATAAAPPVARAEAPRPARADASMRPRMPPPRDELTTKRAARREPPPPPPTSPGRIQWAASRPRAR
jgi:hypothetical protein